MEQIDFWTFSESWGSLDYSRLLGDSWTILDRTEQIVYRRKISHWNQSRFQWSLLGPSQIQLDPWIILDRTEQIVYKVPSRKWAICGNGGKKPLTCRKNCFWGPFGSLGPPQLLQGVPRLYWTRLNGQYITQVENGQYAGMEAKSLYSAKRRAIVLVSQSQLDPDSSGPF